MTAQGHRVTIQRDVSILSTTTLVSARLAGHQNIVIHKSMNAVLPHVRMKGFVEMP